ncbi:MAG: hypothetical protein K2X44_00920, partial [Magnetospirillum sp.]|nr:hypothetical protein [Magnetospirillum sp.]
MIAFTNLPLWVLAPLIVGGSVLATLLSRRFARWAMAGRDVAKPRETANAMRQPIGAIVSLILALASVQVVNEHRKADAAVAKEADVLEDLFRDSR